MTKLPLAPRQRKTLRIGLGLSQSQLADALGSNRDTVSRMERSVDMPTARAAPARVDLLLLAFSKGFRPDGWPEEGRAGTRLRKPEGVPS
jgi:DNA-binding XRE family transcriptional regulator